MSDVRRSAARFLRSARRAALISLALLTTVAPAPARADVSLPECTPTRIVEADTGELVGLDEMVVAGANLDLIGVPAMRGQYPFLTGAGQTIAVIDTGIDYTHPALAGRYLGGYDFADDDPDPMDPFGHGTHVAGIAVSTDATYAGVAPGANVVALKVFPDGSGTADGLDIARAMNWVIDNAATYNITAVNFSLGSEEVLQESDVPSSDIREVFAAELRDMGIFVAAAAGNGGYLHGQSYPAASPETVSVGGVWASDEYSNYLVYWDDEQQWNPDGNYVDARMGDNGPDAGDIMVISNRYKTDDDGQTDLFAPGGPVVSTVPLALDNDDDPNDGFGVKLGTSMATPHVAAASMLVREALDRNGLLDPDPANQVDQILGILQAEGEAVHDWYETLMRREGLGDHSNIVQAPKDPNDIYANWYLRQGSDAVYSRIDLARAIASIDPVPEPASLALLAAGALLAACRRRRNRA